LGLRLVGGELRISPCLPKAWIGFEARIARPAGSLFIRVEDPDGLGAGDVTITVDGERRVGETVAFPTDGTTHMAHVRICARTEDSRGEDNRVVRHGPLVL
jgi:cyclic beta-1,2-glucan synthetase